MANAMTTGAWTAVSTPLVNETGLGTDLLRWGVPGSRGAGQQSGYRFTGRQTAVPTDGSDFTLGTFTHENFPVNLPITKSKASEFDIDLKVTMAFEGADLKRDFSFKLHHTETPNTRTPRDRASADRVGLSTLQSSKTVVIDGTEYAVEITGFMQDGKVVTEFISFENAANSADIVAKLTAIKKPAAAYNVFITRGDTVAGKFYAYFSPDIWVDSPKKGFNLGGGPLPHTQRENPVAGMVNRLYARIHNAGPGTAFDFDVRFRSSEPYHTVGGEADFDTFVGVKHIASLPMGHTDVFVEWTPKTVAPPRRRGFWRSPGTVHSCVRVDLINLGGDDTNSNDNWAQENYDIVGTIEGSPFHPVITNYSLTNPYAEQALFYFRAEGAPPDWMVELVPPKIRLHPGERMTGQITITPPEDARVCSRELLAVSSWTPRDDTLINVGGTVVQVNLRRPTVITLKSDTGRCDEHDLETLAEEAKEQGKKPDFELLRKRCGRVTVQGGLEPPQAGVEVILRYVDPLGVITYRTVTTDANGCFEDFLVSDVVGTWQVSAEYPGGDCQAPAEQGPITVCWCGVAEHSERADEFG